MTVTVTAVAATATTHTTPLTHTTQLNVSLILVRFIHFFHRSYSTARHHFPSHITFLSRLFSGSLYIFAKKNRTIDNQPHHHTRFGRVSGILYVLLRIACTTSTTSRSIASNTNSFIHCCLLSFITCIHIFVVLRLSL